MLSAIFSENIEFLILSIKKFLTVIFLSQNFCVALVGTSPSPLWKPYSIFCFMRVLEVSPLVSQEILSPRWYSSGRYTHMIKCDVHFPHNSMILCKLGGLISSHF